MIRIPLERLLDRLAEEVGSVALDPGADPYARAQLQAAAEILRNLAPRVQWRVDGELDAQIRALGPDDLEAARELAARQLELELARLRR